MKNKKNARETTTTEDYNMSAVTNVDIKVLHLLENNPRTISKEGMAKLCKSIQEDPTFLWSRPVLVHDLDDKLVVYAGNQRVRAAKKLGWKQIPCVIEKGLSEEIIKSRVVKDNKTYGVFDIDILANEWEIEMLCDAGFTEAELLNTFDEDEVDIIEEKKSKKDKKKQCPSCGHQF